MSSTKKDRKGNVSFSLIVPSYAAGSSSASGGARVIDPGSKYFNFYATPEDGEESEIVGEMDISARLQSSSDNPAIETAAITFRMNAGDYSSCRFELLDSDHSVLTSGSQGAFSVSSSGTSTLSLAGLPAGATGLSVGITLASAGVEAGKVAYYSYPVQDGMAYSLAIGAASGAPEMILFDTYGQPCSEGDVSCPSGSTASLSWTSSGTGTAYIAVYGNGAAASYDLSAAAAPVFAVSGSGISRTVALASADSGASIYYTLDGSAPTTSSSSYSGPITVAGFYVAKTIKAIAVSSSAVSSSVRAQTVSIGSCPVLSLTGTLTNFATGFSGPIGITTDGTNLYVADCNYHRIEKVDLSTGAHTTFAGTTSTSGSSDGTGSVASFNNPSGIATDGTNLYVADRTNNLIRKIVIATAEVSTLAGSGDYGSADGIGTAAAFQSPCAITTDGANLYVGEGNGSIIRKIVIATAEVTTIATGFWAPSGITTDGTNLFVADTNNHQIKRIDIATGTVTTLAGSGTAGSADGIGTAATFNNPMGIATDGENLYVADSTSNKIRMIAIGTGAVTTLVGYMYDPRGIITDGTCLYATGYSLTTNHLKKVQ